MASCSARRGRAGSSGYDVAGDARAAVTTLFFVNGTLFASHFARLPAIQERIGLSEGELGLALVGGMIGLIAIQPVAAGFAVRRGAVKVLLVGALGYCVTIALPGVAPSLGRCSGRGC